MEENILQQNTICSDKMDSDTKGRYDILTPKGKCNGKNKKYQLYIISEIFKSNIDKKISKRELERDYTLEFALKPNITNERLKNEQIIINSIDDTQFIYLKEKMI